MECVTSKAKTPKFFYFFFFKEMNYQMHAQPHTHTHTHPPLCSSHANANSVPIRYRERRGIAACCTGACHGQCGAGRMYRLTETTKTFCLKYNTPIASQPAYLWDNIHWQTCTWHYICTDPRDFQNPINSMKTFNWDAMLTVGRRLLLLFSKVNKAI